MPNKKGGSPGSRRVMKSIKNGNPTNIKPFPVLKESVPKSLGPHISSGGSPASKAVNGLVSLKNLFATRPDLKSFPSVENFAPSKNTAMIPEIVASPSEPSIGPEGHLASHMAKSSEKVGGKSCGSHKKKPKKTKKKSTKKKTSNKKSKKKKGGYNWRSMVYSWSANPNLANLQKFSPGAKQYYPTSKKTVANTRMFKPFKKGGKRTKKGGYNWRSMVYSWSLNPEYQKTLQKFSPGAEQYVPTSKNTVADTKMFKPFVKGGRRKSKGRK